MFARSPAHWVKRSRAPSCASCVQAEPSATADHFRKDALLSGPAGGVIGMAETAKLAGFDKVIGFDMGHLYRRVPV